MFGWFFLLSLYLQFVRGYSPLEAGLATLPLPPVFIIMSPRSAAIAARLGSGRTIALGFLLVGAGMAVLAPVTPDTPYVVLAAAMVLLGAGMSITAAPATTSIISAVPMSKAGVASAVNDTTRELGGALGIAVLGTIVSSLYRSRLDLSGLNLPTGTAHEAEASIGEAVNASRQLGSGGAGTLVERAGDAFTEAFGLTAMISAAIAVVAAIVVLRTFSIEKELAAEAASVLADEDRGQLVDLAAEGAAAN
jgi:Na+/melibiose symporter-like transporter